MTSDKSRVEIQGIKFEDIKRKKFIEFTKIQFESLHQRKIKLPITLYTL